ncbi:hypothetical protein [Nonomuraea zeae]|uniref:Uncharacterized protein n=1 Tax=Nonomuraea zeae TaxID=1642303 RepID=A0A5S4GW79_9ACTN|nr:hypothetical protein [Nonomuraea zeae]TMR37215.1 hypothetical protein ETD85_08810 [Nonomuraea zeae]
MATEFWSLDGGVLTVDDPGAAAWPVASSAMATRGWLGRAVLQATSSTWLHLHLERYEGMRPTESYHHPSGPVRLMAGPLYGQRDFAYYGDQHALLWESGDVGLMLQADGRSKQWFLDYAQQVRFEANGRSVRARPARSTDWTFEHLRLRGQRLRLTIPDVGSATVADPAEAAKPIRSDRSKRLRSGTLHTFDAQRQQRVVLDAGNTRLEITLIETTVDSAAERLAELRSVDWRP